jgi:hypothetical protein
MPDRAALRAYVEGRLTASEAHALERRMEEDPLLREAIEGLRMPGAATALDEMQRHRPDGRSDHGPGALTIGVTIVALVFIAGLWIVVSPLLEQEDEPKRDMPTVTEAPVPTSTTSAPLDAMEIAAAEEQPETLRIGHRTEERPMPAPAVDREPGVEPIPSVTPTAPSPDLATAKPERARRTSRRLLFPHDLKLVHPDELYPYEPTIDPSDLGVSAQYPDRKSQEASTTKPRTMRYTDYLERGLGKFARNDHKGCLEDLRIVLEQYPDDVNALFYAGLCSYNLALYSRARTFLHRAATHPIDSFQEEAVWYHALTLERLGDEEAAQEAFARIVAENGFYAERARPRLRTP